MGARNERLGKQPLTGCGREGVIRPRLVGLHLDVEGAVPVLQGYEIGGTVRAGGTGD
jgi:hypothetical protein